MEKIYKIGNRPANIPQDHIIINAQRPIMADIMWQGDSYRGIFYGAISPESDLFEKSMEYDRKMDAREMVFVNMDQVNKIILERNPKYGAKILALYDEKQLKNYFYNLVNKD